MKQNSRAAPVLFTIGYQKLGEAAELVRIMRALECRTLFDVRSSPRSRIAEFNQARISRAVTEADIYYFHEPGAGGHALRGFRGDVRTEGYRVFDASALERIESSARRGFRPMLMCLEEAPGDCHRHLLATELARRGIDARHVFGQEIFRAADLDHVIFGESEDCDPIGLVCTPTKESDADFAV